MNNPLLKKMIEGKQGVLFDLWHTLTATELVPYDGPNTMELLGISKERWVGRLLGFDDGILGKVQDPFEVMKALAHSIDPDVPENRIAQAADHRLRRHEKALMEAPVSSVATLESLKKSGKRLGLVSNAYSMEVVAWPRSPLAPHFECAIFSCDVGLAKPDPKIFQACLRQMKLLPSECLFVGDGGSKELEAARNMGMSTVMVAGIARTVWPDHLEARMKLADFVIEEVSELVG